MCGTKVEIKRSVTSWSSRSIGNTSLYRHENFRLWGVGVGMEQFEALGHRKAGIFRLHLYIE